jgi:hypothetical protein
MHPLLTGTTKQQRSTTIAEKGILQKSKGPRISGKRAAIGPETSIIPNKRAKTKKSSEYYQNNNNF